MQSLAILIMIWTLLSPFVIVILSIKLKGLSARCTAYEKQFTNEFDNLMDGGDE